MRDDTFLQEKLDYFLNGAFEDVPQMNKIEIAFGRRAQRRFGSIKMARDKRVSQITINGVFRDEKIPEEIILATIAHELCHYAHGFSSPLPKKYRHPHQGGVIKREMKGRGLVLLYEFEKQWTKAHWREVLLLEFPRSRPRRARRVQRKTFIRSLLGL
jgi:hypothetical protein